VILRPSHCHRNSIRRHRQAKRASANARKIEREIGRFTALTPEKAIAWDFVFPDDSVQAYTDRHIAPDGPLLKIAKGGYRVEPLDDDSVRLTLHTTYRMRSRLGWYLDAWGELLLGDVEDNVLAIIKQRVE
jgi:hypothetical protein